MCAGRNKALAAISSLRQVWKPYYQLPCHHALCNAHHLRELERAWEQDQQQWAKQTQALLLEINEAVSENGICE